MTFGSDGVLCNSRGLPEGSIRYRRAAGQGKWRRLGMPARPFFCFCFTGPFTPAFAQCPFLLVFPTKNGHFEEAPSCLLSPPSLLCALQQPPPWRVWPSQLRTELSSRPRRWQGLGMCPHAHTAADRCLSELGIRVTATGRAVY